MAESLRTPVFESWVHGRRLTGKLEFQWLKDEPMPSDFARLRDLHMSDAATVGELPNFGKARFRVVSISMADDIDAGLRTGTAGIEVLSPEVILDTSSGRQFLRERPE